jgi:hypothetical protein
MRYGDRQLAEIVGEGGGASPLGQSRANRAPNLTIVRAPVPPFPPPAQPKTSSNRMKIN